MLTQKPNIQKKNNNTISGKMSTSKEVALQADLFWIHANSDVWFRNLLIVVIQTYKLNHWTSVINIFLMKLSGASNIH